MATEKQKLVELTTRFRAACERYGKESEEPLYPMEHFPWDCCTLASVGLMRFLADEGIGKAELWNFHLFPKQTVSGHDILFINSWTIDITNDQFGKRRKPVVIRRPEQLPKSWIELHKFGYDEFFKREPAPFREAMYQEIRKYLS